MKLNSIFKRRSIRKYVDDPISDEDLDRIIEAGQCAPTAMGKRPWHFIVIRKREILDRIPKIHPYAKMVSESNLAVIVCGDTRIQNVEGYMSQDLSAATQNILLEATDLGIGSVWCGIYPRTGRISGFRELLNIPEEIVPFSLIVLGYPAVEPEYRDRFDPERIHREGW
ncbi:MAG: nitroreductase family protein [Thermoplasmatota archaeon]